MNLVAGDRIAARSDGVHGHVLHVLGSLRLVRLLMCSQPLISALKLLHWLAEKLTIDFRSVDSRSM